MKIKPNLSVFFAILTFSCSCFGQSWDFVYDSIASMGRQLIIASDSSYLITAVNDGWESANLTIKLDQQGNIIWFSPNGGFTITETYDNKFVIGGSNYPHSVLKKIDQSGNLEWYNTYGGGSQEEYSKVIQSSDTCLVACGFTQNHGDSTFLARKTDRDGNTLWTHCFHSLYYNGFHDMIEFDNFYYLVGNERDESGDLWYLFLVKMTLDGEVIWQKYYYKKLYRSSITVTADSLLVIAGWKHLLKFNTDGDSLWSASPDGLFMIEDISNTSVNGFIVSGSYDHWGNVPMNFLSELDEMGNIIWMQTYPTDLPDPTWGDFVSVRPTFDGGYIAGGYSEYPDSRDETLVRVVKTDSVGGIITGFDINPDPGQFNIYPNPTTGRIHIDATGTCNIEVYNSIGMFVGSVNNNDDIDLSNYERGIYLIRITTEHGIFSKKIIKR